MFLPDFEYLAPRTTAELAGCLDRYGERARVLAGGTDLLVLMKDRAVRPEYLVDIGNIPELRGMEYREGEGLTIGAATRIADLERSALLRRRYRCLWQAAGELGSAQVRQMATVGGNSCNASPAAETPPPLVTLGAVVRLVSQAGRREMALADFILGNRKTALKPGEFLESFFLPEPAPRTCTAYRWQGLRQAMEIDMVNCAVSLTFGEDGRITGARVVLGAVAPRPLPAEAAAAVLQGQAPGEELFRRAGELAAEAAAPIDDIRASAWYRREIVAVLVRRALNEAWQEAMQGEGKV